MTEPSHFDVFLSHNSGDKPEVRALADWLGKHEVTYFLDEKDLNVGDKLTDALGDAIEKSTSAIICIGPHGEGPWHKEETDTLLNRAIKLSRQKNEFRLIPVLLPNADTSKLRWFLETRLWCDLRKGIADSEAELYRLKRAILGERPDHTIAVDPKFNPYQGLKAFDRDTAKFFFGRATESADLATMLRDWRFACIIGASGNGKSSLARAGLSTEAANRIVPGIDDWKPLTVKPGNDLLRSLLEQLFVKIPNEERGAAIAAALARITPDGKAVTVESWAGGLDQELRWFYSGDKEPVVILIDQFEEIFTHRGFGIVTEEERERQIKLILDGLAAISQVGHRRWKLIITLRSDFKHRCRISESFWNLLYKKHDDRDEPHLALELDELNEEGWREAIKGPAARAGAYLEAGLVETMLKDVYRQHGSMPLLQLALQELWKLRNGACLTHAAYTSIGGVANALQRRAEAALSLLKKDDPEYLEIARNLFLRLTSPGEGVSDTRRRVDRCELEWEHTDSVKIDHVVTFLSNADNRMIVADAQSLEVTHEVLIRDCSTIRAWIEPARREIPFLRRLTYAARRWEENERDPIYLNAADPPRELKNWITKTVLRLTKSEREYWQASRADRARMLVEKRTQRTRLENEQKQRTSDAIRAKNRITLIARVASICAVAAVVLAIVASVAFVHSRSERDTAEKAVASGFVRSLGHNERATQLNPIEMNTLWELAAVDNERIHNLFSATGLNAPEDARHLRRRLEVAAQAAVGLRDDRRTAVRAVLIAKLPDPKTDELVKRTCVDMGLALRETDSVFSAGALKAVLESDHRFDWRGEDILFLANHVDPRDALNLARQSVERFKTEARTFLDLKLDRINFNFDSTNFPDETIRPELSVLLKKLDPKLNSDDARQLATSFVEELMKLTLEDDDRGKWYTSYLDVGFHSCITRSYASVAEHLDPEYSKATTAALAKRIGETATRVRRPSELELLIRLIKRLKNLPSADVNEEVKILAKRLHTIVKSIETGFPPEEAPEKGETDGVPVAVPVAVPVGVPFDEMYLRSLANCVVELQDFKTVIATEPIVELVVVECLRALRTRTVEELFNAQGVRIGFYHRYSLSSEILAIQTIAPYSTKALLPTKIMEEMAQANRAEQRWLWIHLLNAVIEQSSPDRITAGAADELWKQAAKRLFVEMADSSWNPGQDTTRVIQAAAIQLGRNEKQFEKFLSALRQLSKHAPEKLRQELEAPFWWADDNFFLADQGPLFFDLYDVFCFKAAIKTASPNQRATLARALLRKLPPQQPQREQPEYYSPMIVSYGELRPLGSERLPQTAPAASAPTGFETWWLACAFVEVADSLSATEAAIAARSLLDRAERAEGYGRDTEGMAKMLISLVPQLPEADVLKLTQRIALGFEASSDRGQLLGIHHAFRRLASRLPQESASRRPQEALIELLKWPNCVGVQRALLLTEIGSRVNQKFESIWELVAWAKESDKKLYATLKSAPRRPSDEETRSGERLAEPTPAPAPAPVFAPAPAPTPPDG